MDNDHLYILANVLCKFNCIESARILLKAKQRTEQSVNGLVFHCFFICGKKMVGLIRRKQDKTPEKEETSEVSRIDGSYKTVIYVYN